MFVHDDDSLQLVVKDDGVGIDFDEIKKKRSLGLTGMKERARMFRGEVIIENMVPQGTVVTLKVPLAGNNRDSA